MIIRLPKLPNVMQSFFSLIKKIRVEHIASVVLLVAVSLLTFDYIRLQREFSTYKLAHAESVKLVQDVKTIKAKLAHVDAILSRVNRFSSKLRMIASIPQQTFGTQFAANPQPTRIQSLEEGPYTLLDEKIDTDSLKIRVEDVRSDVSRHEQMLADLNGVFDENPTLLASVPSINPARGRVTSRFGFRRNPGGKWQMHEGVDIAAYYGTRVITPADGLVEKVAYSPSYGRHLVIDHGYGLKTTFAHTSEVLVKPGQYVKRGKRIALVGRTGRARGTHLHYEVRLNGVVVDPATYLFN